jgi:hypothetical protein
MSIVEIAAAALLVVWPLAMPAQSQAPKSAVREHVTVSGTVERAERSTRTLTLRTSPNTTQVVTVGPELKLFDELKTGDRITVRVTESVIVAVRPGGKPSVPVDTTASATPSGPSGKSDVIQQLKAAVTIQSVDRSQNLVAYRTADNTRAVRLVLNPQLLEGLKPGDVVEITYTRERAVDLQRAR